MPENARRASPPRLHGSNDKSQQQQHEQQQQEQQQQQQQQQDIALEMNPVRQDANGEAARGWRASIIETAASARQRITPATTDEMDEMRQFHDLSGLRVPPIWSAIMRCGNRFARIGPNGEWCPDMKAELMYRRNRFTLNRVVYARAYIIAAAIHCVYEVNDLAQLYMPDDMTMMRDTPEMQELNYYWAWPFLLFRLVVYILISILLFRAPGTIKKHMLSTLSASKCYEALLTAVFSVLAMWDAYSPTKQFHVQMTNMDHNSTHIQCTIQYWQNSTHLNHHRFQAATEGWRSGAPSLHRPDPLLAATAPSLHAVTTPSL